MRRSHKTTNRQIETGRAELPLIVTVGREGNDFIGIAGVFQSLNDGSIDLGITSPAPLVGDLSAVTHTRQYQAMLDFANRRLIAAQPSNRADRPRNEKETVGISSRARAKSSGQERGKGDSGQIVVCQRWMADVR